MSEEDSLSSPNSRRTRQQEKEELASLNDRFLAYKERIRTLTEQNTHLQYEIEQVTVRSGRDMGEMKKLYDKELADARRLIDETAKEKAKQQLNASKYLARVKELEAERDDLKDELNSLKGRVVMAERSAASNEAQKKSLLQDKVDLQRELKSLESERDELRNNVDELRAALESETLQKVDCQNNLQSLREEIEFQKKVHEEEVHTIRSKYTISPYVDTFEPSNIDLAIDELREHRDFKIDELKDLFQRAYKDKIDNLEKESTRYSTVIDQLRTEVYSLTRSLKEKSGDVASLQEKIDKLEALVESKEADMNSLRHRHASEKSKLAEELRNLRASYNEKLKEYEELFDLKVSLDQEIATYRALLEEEEARLKLSPTPRKRERTTTLKEDSSAKRTRLGGSPGSSTKHHQQQQQQQKMSSSSSFVSTEKDSSSSRVSSSAAGCIQIADVDPEGRFMVIKNLSNAPESVGGFKIVHEVDGGKEVVFKFHQKSKLQGNASVTVWGAQAEGATHSPPQQIIWRNQATWGAGGRTVTKLLNKSNDVVATFTHTCDTIDAGSSSSNLSFPHLSEEGGERTLTSSTSTSTTRRGTEHVFHQRGDPQRGGQENSCVVS